MPPQDKNISEEVKDIIKNLKAPNIAVIGRTGTGKSTLVNKVFGIDFAKTGAGLPITESFCRFPPEDSDKFSPVVIYDSPGYEATKEAEWVKNVIQFLDEKKAEGVEKQIHLVWYTINASSARVENFEIDILRKIKEQHLPAIIVLSQCDRAKDAEKEGIKKALDDFQLEKIYSVIETAADPLLINDKPICEPFGLKELVNKTLESLPDAYSEAVIVAQIADLKSKRELAWKYIAGAATACFAAGFVPVPGSTPTAAIASQTALCIQIASIYGYREQAEFVLAISGFTAANVGNILLTGISDLITTFFPPAAGYTGAMAASFITGIGLTYASVFENLAKANIRGDGKEAVEAFLKDHFRKEFQRYGSLNINSPQALNIVRRTFTEGE